MNNSKLFVSGICLLVLTLAAPLTTEAGRGGGGAAGGARVMAMTMALSGVRRVGNQAERRYEHEGVGNLE